MHIFSVCQLFQFDDLFLQGINGFFSRINFFTKFQNHLIWRIIQKTRILEFVPTFGQKLIFLIQLLLEV